MKRIPIAKPVLGEPEIDAVIRTLRSGWVTQGPAVQRFEESFRSYVGASFAVAMSSCTTALHLALIAAGVRPGDVVLTVSHSFIATANAIRYCQAEPIFVDIDERTLNMDPASLLRALEEDFDHGEGGMRYRDTKRLHGPASPLGGRTGESGRLGAILIVHQVGMPADLGRILPAAQRHGIPVVEDAACATGSEIRLREESPWEKIGLPHGDMACFSFHPRKVITTGDGGMLTTSTSASDKLARALRHHGMNVSDLERHAADAVIFEEYPLMGYNYRMTDIQASIGSAQVARLPGLIRERRDIAARYGERLSGIDGLRPPVEPPYAKSNWQSYIVQLRAAEMQRPFMERLLERGISSRRGVMCAHLERPYSDAWPSGSLPVSERARDCCVVLPLYPGMTSDDIDRVCDGVRAVALETL